MNIDIASRLYELRKKNSLSQEELAEKIGVSRQAVSKWERAEASPDTDNLILLARLYGVSIDELLSTDEPIEPTSTQDGTPMQTQGAEQFKRSEEEEPEMVFSWKRFPYPLIVTILYLLLGFTFGVWHPAWILFLTIPIYYSVFEKGGHCVHERRRER